MKMMIPVEKAFRELREAWFSAIIKSCEHEREWEEESQSRAREKHNKSLKVRYAEDTEAIVRGHVRAVSPRSDSEVG